MLIQRTTATAFRLAQLRQGHDRRALRRRERRHRAAAGVLPRYYQPDNAVLTSPGKFDPDRALALVAKYFGAIPKPTRALPKLYTDEPVQDGEREVTLRRVGNTQWLSARCITRFQARILMRWRFPPPSTRMTVSPAGRLYKALVETKKAAAVDDFVYTGHDPGFAMFLAQVPENESLDAARDAMLQTIEDVGEAAVHPSGNRPRPSQGAEGRSTRRSTIRNGSGSRSPSRSPPATGGCSSCNATAGAR